MMKGLVCLQD